jgi:hypothetical protein
LTDLTAEHPFFGVNIRAGSAAEILTPPTAVLTAAAAALPPPSVPTTFAPFVRTGHLIGKVATAIPRHGSSKHERIGIRKAVQSTSGRPRGEARRKFLIKDGGAFSSAFPDKRVVEIGKVAVFNAEAEAQVKAIATANGPLSLPFQPTLTLAPTAAVESASSVEDDTVFFDEKNSSMSMVEVARPSSRMNQLSGRYASPRPESQRSSSNNSESDDSGSTLGHNLDVGTLSPNMRAKSDGGVFTEQRKHCRSRRVTSFADINCVCAGHAGRYMRIAVALPCAPRIPHW